MPRVLLFTDEPVLTRGLTACLASTERMELCGVCADVSQLVSQAQSSNPDVLLLDLTPDVTFGTLADLRKQVPNCRIVLWVRSIPVGVAVQAVELGVHGILRKTLSIELLVKCLEKVSAGEHWFGKRLVKNFLEAKTLNLSSRQSQLVRLLAQGLSNKHIASILNIKEGTVKVYLSRLYQKAGVKDRFELVLYGLKNLIDPRPLESMAAKGPGRAQVSGEGLVAEESDLWTQGHSQPWRWASLLGTL